MPKTPKINYQEQIKTLDENWKRALADYQNLVRRVESDKRDFIRLANINVISRLIPSLDILEMAASHSEDVGVQMATKQFHEALVQEGLEVISPQVGDVYDHIIHECTEVIAGEPVETIAEIVLKGYKISDYILRPAKVKVYKKL